MAKDKNKLSLFDRAMNLADRFFAGVEKFKKLGKEAEKRNVEILDEKIPGFKESYERAGASGAALGKKLEAKTEKILFGREMHFGPSDDKDKPEQKHPSLNDQMKHASDRASAVQSKTYEKTKESHMEERD